MSVTRELFWSLPSLQIVLFYAISAAVLAVFAIGILHHVLRYRRGRPLTVRIDVGARFLEMIARLASHRPLRRRDKAAGIAHAGIFFGFVLLMIGTTIIFVDSDIYQALFGHSFWNGTFYLIFSLALDLAGLGLLAGLIFMAVRRATFRLRKLSYVRRYLGEPAARPAARRWRIEDWVFLGWLGAIVLTGFLQEGLRLTSDSAPDAGWSPVGSVVAAVLSAFGLTAQAASEIRPAHWWFHAAISLAFIAAIPWFKARHMLAAIGSLSLRDPKALRRLPPVVARADPDGSAVDEPAGATRLTDLTWKALVQFDACTKCGRCHEACPATHVGAPLSPRDLILDLKALADQHPSTAGAARTLHDVISAETLWSCLSCGACQEICPVGIEHPPLIVEMRRALVEQGEMPPQLRATFDAVASTGNSFGEPARRRGGWTGELEFAVKDLRQEPAEWLWFVGDYASFEPRNQAVSRTVAKLLRAAKVDFGLLYEGERTAGNDIRRAGEEGLFQALAEHNLAAFASAQSFKKIVTTDPHSLNTLRNEYAEMRALPPVSHYAAMLAELLETGRLKVVKPLGARVTLHDPCHLGRLNGEYDAPRNVLRAIGCEVVEMARCRENSFCCGAGGGRIWIPDPPGKERPSENRIREAAALEAIDYFVTCCPKDLTMFEDARKSAGCEGAFQVRDLAELVAEAVDLQSLSSKDWGMLAEQRTGEPPSEPLPATIDAAAPAPVAGADGPAVAADGGVLAPMSKDWRLIPVPAADLAGYVAPSKAGVRILVAVKHANATSDDLVFHPDGRDVDPSVLSGDLNEWDDTAIEEALLKAEQLRGAEIVAVTVGPPSAEASLRKVLAKGATRAVRVWNDRLRDTVDPISIARLIAGVARHEQPDLILAGAQSSDHAHGATGVALARILGWSHAAVATGIDWDGGATVTVVREIEGGVQHVQRLPVPAVVTVQTGMNVPRYATLRMVKQAKAKQLAVLDAGEDALEYAGFVVRRMYVPDRRQATMLAGSVEELAKQVGELIRQRGGGA
jgi:Fe-S oxidoreductase/electron transfer flavoprotein alpha/beta subunit